MDKNKQIVNYAILSWTRLKMNESRQNNQDKKNKILKEIKELEEYLLNCGIENINIMYISDDYYTVRYFKEDKQYIKQFTIEEVELNIK